METEEEIRAEIRKKAVTKHKIEAVVESYRKAVEEVINVKDLVVAFDAVVKSGQLQEVIDEIVVQSKVEFFYGDAEAEDNGNGVGQLAIDDED